MTLIRDLFDANGCDIVTHTEDDMQNLMNVISMVCEELGFTINQMKLFSAPGLPYVELGSFVYERNLTLVSEFI